MNNSDKKSMYEETQFDVYVPRETHCYDIDPGSAIVATKSQRGNTEIKVYFESNRFGADNVHRFEEKCRQAAGRAATRYPTAAMMVIPADELIRVAEYNLMQPDTITVLQGELMKAWVNSAPVNDHDTFTAVHIPHSGINICRTKDPLFSCATVKGYPSQEEVFAKRVVAALNAFAGMPLEAIEALTPKQVKTALKIAREQIGNGYEGH